MLISAFLFPNISTKAEDIVKGTVFKTTEFNF